MDVDPWAQDFGPVHVEQTTQNTLPSLVKCFGTTLGRRHRQILRWQPRQGAVGQAQQSDYHLG